MKYDQVRELQGEELPQLTRIQHNIFDKMVTILNEAESNKRAQGGKRKSGS